MRDRLYAVIVYIGCFVAAMWVVFLLEGELGRSFYEWGIAPRSLAGLRGIICAPFLHGSLEHLIGNSIPFLILGSLIALQGSTVCFRALMTIIIVGGLLVWLLGKPTYHIGASGVVFGFLGYLLSYGWYVRRLLPLLVSLAVLLLYGGALIGILPSDPRVAWYSHLFGLLAGMMAARDQAEFFKAEKARQ